MYKQALDKSGRRTELARAVGGRVSLEGGDRRLPIGQKARALTPPEHLAARSGGRVLIPPPKGQLASERLHSPYAQVPFSALSFDGSYLRHRTCVRRSRTLLKNVFCSSNSCDK